MLAGHRYYQPQTRRWVNRDPIGYDGGINLYEYAGNDPVNEADPDGNGSSPIGQFLSGALSEVVSIDKASLEQTFVPSLYYAQVSTALSQSIATKGAKGTAVAIVQGIRHNYTDAFDPKASYYARGSSAVNVAQAFVGIVAGVGLAGAARGGAIAVDESAATVSTEGAVAAEIHPRDISQSISDSLRRAASRSFRFNAELELISPEDRELAAQMYEKLAEHTLKSQNLTRLYNLERAKFLRGQVDHILTPIQAFAKEYGIPNE